MKLWSVEDVSLMDDIAEMNRKFGKISGIDKSTVNIATAGHADTEGVPGEEHVQQGVHDDHEYLLGEVDGDQRQVAAVAPRTHAKIALKLGSLST